MKVTDSALLSQLNESSAKVSDEDLLRKLNTPLGSPSASTGVLKSQVAKPWNQPVTERFPRVKSNVRGGQPMVKSLATNDAPRPKHNVSGVTDAQWADMSPDERYNRNKQYEQERISLGAIEPKPVSFMDEWKGNFGRGGLRTKEMALSLAPTSNLETINKRLTEIAQTGGYTVGLGERSNFIKAYPQDVALLNEQKRILSGELNSNRQDYEQSARGYAKTQDRIMLEQKLGQADGLMDTLNAMDSPATLGLLSESLVSSTPMIAMSALTRNPAYLAMIGTLGAGAQEYSIGVMDYFQQNNIDPETATPEQMQDAFDYTNTRTGIVGAAGGLGSLVAGTRLIPKNSMSPAKTVLAEGGAQALVNTGIEGGGEALAGAATGNFNWGDTLLEAGGGAVTAPIEATQVLREAHGQSGKDFTATSTPEQLAEVARNPKTNKETALAAMMELMQRGMSLDEQGNLVKGVPEPVNAPKAPVTPLGVVGQQIEGQAGAVPVTPVVPPQEPEKAPVEPQAPTTPVELGGLINEIFGTPKGQEETVPQGGEVVSPLSEPTTPPAVQPLGGERRTDPNERKRIDDLTIEEARKELRTDPLTGGQNRRAYDETPKRAVQVSTDMDGLKAVNDTFGHSAGDTLIKAYHQTLIDNGLEVYRLGGDEFAIQFNTDDEADSKMQKAQADFGRIVFTFQTPDGKIVTKTGLGASYGKGKTFDEADANLIKDKQRRKDAGLRGERGELNGGAQGLAEGNKAPVSQAPDWKDNNLTKDGIRKNPSTRKQSAGLDRFIVKLARWAARGEIKNYQGNKISPKNIDVSEIERSELPVALAKAIELSEKAFNTPVVLYRKEGKSRQYGFSFNGITTKSGNSIYVDSEGSRPVISILFHEFTHQLSGQENALYQRLADYVRKNGDIDRHSKDRGYSRLGFESRVEELVADLTGDAMNNPDFLRTLAKKDPTLFGELAEKLIDFIDNFIAKLGLKGQNESYGSNKYLNDVMEFRELLADVMVEYGKIQKNKNSPISSKPSSKDDSPIMSVADIEKLSDNRGSLKTFAQQFADRIKQKDRTIEDANRIAKGFVDDFVKNPSDFLPKVKGENLSVDTFLRMPDGTKYDPNKLEHANATDQTIQIHNAVQDGRIKGALNDEAEAINKKRADDLSALASYINGNADYSLAEQAIILKGAASYGVRINQDKQVKLVPITDSNTVNIAVITSREAAAVAEELRNGKTMKQAMTDGISDAVAQQEKANKRRGMDGWKVFKQSDKLEDAVALKDGCAGRSWCTASATSTAQSQLSQGDFHVFYKDGSPILALRTEDGKLAEPPRGSLDGQRMTEEEEAIAEEALRAGRVTGGEDYLHDRKLISDVMSGKYKQWSDIELFKGIDVKRKAPIGYSRDASKFPLPVVMALQKEFTDRHSIDEWEKLGFYTQDLRIYKSRDIVAVRGNLYVYRDAVVNVNYVTGDLDVSDYAKVTVEEAFHLNAEGSSSIKAEKLGGVNLRDNSTVTVNVVSYNAYTSGTSRLNANIIEKGLDAGGESVAVVSSADTVMSDGISTVFAKKVYGEITASDISTVYSDKAASVLARDGSTVNVRVVREYISAKNNSIVNVHTVGGGVVASASAVINAEFIRGKASLSPTGGNVNVGKVKGDEYGGNGELVNHIDGLKVDEIKTVSGIGYVVTAFDGEPLRKGDGGSVVIYKTEEQAENAKDAIAKEIRRDIDDGLSRLKTDWEDVPLFSNESSEESNADEVDDTPLFSNNPNTKLDDAKSFVAVIEGVRSRGFDSLTSRADALQKAVPQLKPVFKKIFIFAGSKGVGAKTIIESAEQIRTTFHNEVEKTIEVAFGHNKDLSEQENDELRQAVLGFSVPTPAIQQAGQRISELMKQARDRAEAAGIPIGEVTDIGYLPRVYKTHEIQKDKEGFLRDATRLFHDHEFELEVGDASQTYTNKKMLSKYIALMRLYGLTDPAVKEAVRVVKDQMRIIKGTKDQATRIAAFQEIINQMNAVRPIVQQKYAEMRANAWFIGMGMRSMRDYVNVVPDPKARPTKNRVLSGAADTVMKDWLDVDIRELMSGYAGVMSRKISASEAFGKDPIKKVDSLLNAIKRRGEMSESQADEAYALISAAMGWKDRPHDSIVRNVWDGVATLATISLLEQATFTSLAEPITTTIRTGNLKHLLLPLRQLATVRSRAKDRDVAYAIGMIARNAYSAVSLHRVGVMEADYSQWSSKTLTRFFTLNMLTQLTNDQRLLAMRVGAEEFKRLAKKALRGNPMAIDFMNEHGISDIQAFSDWMESINGIPQASDIYGADGAMTPMGQIYADAVHRFVNGSIQNPNTTLKPAWASDPKLRLVSGIMSFAYAIYENLIKRELRILAGGTKAEAVNRFSTVFAPTMVALIVSQVAISALRMIMNGDDPDDEEFWEKATKRGTLNVVSFGISGQMLNFITGYKYASTASETLIGAYPAYFAKGMDLVMKSFSDRNSENTETAENSKGKGIYDLIVAPTVLAGATNLPASYKWFSRLVIGIESHKQTREKFAEMFGIPAERENATDKQYTKATKGSEEATALVTDKLGDSDKAQWDAQFEAMKKEFPELLEGYEFVRYADNSENRKKGRAGDQQTTPSGKVKLKNGNLDKIEDEKDLITSLNKSLKSIRSNSDMTYADLSNVIKIGDKSYSPVADEILADIDEDEMEDEIGRATRVKVIKDLEASRTEVKKKAIQDLK